MLSMVAFIVTTVVSSENNGELVRQIVKVENKENSALFIITNVCVMIVGISGECIGIGNHSASQDAQVSTSDGQTGFCSMEVQYSIPNIPSMYCTCTVVPTASWPMHD